MTPPSVPNADLPSERPGSGADVAASGDVAASVDTADGGSHSGGGGGPEPAVPARRIPRRWLWAGVGLSVVAVIAGILFIPTPYYLFQPGSVRPAETQIDVSGAPSFETKGDVLFTTVYVNQASVATLLRGFLDDAVEIKSEEEVYGKEGRDKSRQENQQRMDLSKLIATKVALEYLGYPASFTGRGATVLGVAADGGAVGRLEVGDVITSVDGDEIKLPSDIHAALSDKAPGDAVVVTARRGTGGSASTIDTTITLGAAPTGDGAGSTDGSPAPATTAPATTVPADVAAPSTTAPSTTAPSTTAPSTTAPSTTAAGSPAATAPRPVLGISVEPADPSISSPVKVAIDSGDVTGPSAGLAWALAVVDRMTPESLTGGKNVAVTGEILADGSVGPIGGIVQKVAAVKRAGVTTFLYPASTSAKEQRQMRAVAGDAVRLVPVATLAEAVDALHPGGVQKPS